MLFIFVLLPGMYNLDPTRIAAAVIGWIACVLLLHLSLTPDYTLHRVSYPLRESPGKENTFLAFSLREHLAARDVDAYIPSGICESSIQVKAVDWKAMFKYPKYYFMVIMLI